MDNDGTIIIDTPEGIAAFGWLQLIHALALEINTSMKLSRGVNIMAVAASRGYNGPTRGTLKNKKLALEWAVKQLDPGYVPGSVVSSALAKEA